MEQRFKETSKQDNPHLLRVGAFKIYCERKQTATAVFFFTEQRFEKCLRFEEPAKQNNPYLLRVGALKIYCERKQTAISSLFYSYNRHFHGLLFFSCTLTVFGVIILYIVK